MVEIGLLLCLLQPLSTDNQGNGFAHAGQVRAELEPHVRPELEDKVLSNSEHCHSQIVEAAVL